MSDAGDERRAERESLTREVRQRLESLRRAGLQHIPACPVVVSTPRIVTARLVESPTPSEPARIVEPPKAPTPKPAVPVAPRPAALPAASLFGKDEAESPVVPAMERPALLEALRVEVAGCTRCAVLAASRTQTVFGVGSPNARLMFIGEAPGADEDRTGEPFVGKAGQLLNDMITKGMGLARADVYIANVLKSRPPNNRDPLPDEVANCLPYLERQIAIVRPEYLCILGKVAASTLLETALPLSRLRGRWHRFRGIATVVTYHPAFLLRTPASKKEAWDDLQMLMKAMGITPPGRKKG